MKYLVLLAALAAMMPAAAAAQQVDADMRCLLVSHAFAAGSKVEAEKRVAGLSEAFYLGRIDARIAPSALVGAVRAQGKGVAATEAAAIMNACAAKAEQANKRLQAAGQQAAAGK